MSISAANYKAWFISAVLLLGSEVLAEEVSQGAVEFCNSKGMAYSSRRLNPEEDCQIYQQGDAVEKAYDQAYSQAADQKCLDALEVTYKTCWKGEDYESFSFGGRLPEASAEAGVAELHDSMISKEVDVHNTHARVAQKCRYRAVQCKNACSGPNNQSQLEFCVEQMATVVLCEDGRGDRALERACRSTNTLERVLADNEAPRFISCHFQRDHEGQTGAYLCDYSGDSGKEFLVTGEGQPELNQGSGRVFESVHPGLGGDGSARPKCSHTAMAPRVVYSSEHCFSDPMADYSIDVYDRHGELQSNININCEGNSSHDAAVCVTDRPIEVDTSYMAVLDNSVSPPSGSAHCLPYEKLAGGHSFHTLHCNAAAFEDLGQYNSTTISGYNRPVVDPVDPGHTMYDGVNSSALLYREVDSSTYITPEGEARVVTPGFGEPGSSGSGIKRREFWGYKNVIIAPNSNGRLDGLAGGGYIPDKETLDELLVKTLDPKKLEYGKGIMDELR